MPKALIAAEATDVLHQRVPGGEQMAMAALSFDQSRTVTLPFGNILARSLYGKLTLVCKAVTFSVLQLALAVFAT